MEFIIYGKDNCSFCDKAKAFLTIKNIEYQYYTLGKDYSREDLLDIAPSARTLPQIWLVDDTAIQEHIGGYNDLEAFFVTKEEKSRNEFLELLKNNEWIDVWFNGIHDVIKLISLEEDTGYFEADSTRGPVRLSYKDIDMFQIIEED